MRASFFDPASLLWRLRERNPDLPLIHIDRERTTGWSHVPVRISRILVDGPAPVPDVDGAGRPCPGSRSGWSDHPLLSTPLGRCGGRTDGPGTDPPFSRGLVLLLPFEMAELWEPSGGPFKGPEAPAVVAECAEVVSFHQPSGRLFLPDGFDRDLLAPAVIPPPSPLLLRPSMDRAGFSRIFRSIREGLERGDYLVNIALRFLSATPARFDPLSVYARVLARSRSRYGGFFAFGDRFVLSHSPEQLLSMTGDRVRTRPIAGTAAGAFSGDGPDPLLSDPKINAEHIMTVDLLRNDIGRVCRPGTVRVPSLLAVESYPHLRHLVSEVEGTVDPRLSRSEVLRALFPGGSVTGAPRIRVRREIGVLEGVPRNYYCGTMGYVSASGEVDLSLLIRTLEGVREKAGGCLTFGSGAGIVADSVEEEEYAEMILKARGMGEVLA